MRRDLRALAARSRHRALRLERHRPARAAGRGGHEDGRAGASPRARCSRAARRSCALWCRAARARRRSEPTRRRSARRPRRLRREHPRHGRGRPRGRRRVVVIGPVYRDRVEHPPEGDWIAERRAALRAAMEPWRVPYLEVPELTEASWPGNQPLFLEHIHPNHKGHRLLAERLLALPRRAARCSATCACRSSR